MNDDAHEYKDAELACAKCGAVNVVPSQRPEDLARPQGVKWECVTCGAGNIVGGHPVPPDAGYVLECASCHSTFDPNTIDQASDGVWSCPSCGQDQCHVHLGESGVGGDAGGPR